ncbi:MAG: hypothetical protein ACE5EN_02125 [Nitrospinota bacterium]
MDQRRRDRIFSEINRLLLESEFSAEERENMLQSFLHYHLDQMEELGEIDLFQDMVNEMIDDYVEQHFEDSNEENYN